MADPGNPTVKIKVVGVGGAGGNAVTRMKGAGLRGVDFLALNTDVQALARAKGIHTFAIGPKATGGLGSGGRPEVGRKAIKESQQQVTQLLKGADMVFVTAGMGGGTGSGAAAHVTDIARRGGALTVAIVTLPFSFEGPRRRAVAETEIRQLGEKAHTLITVDNDRLLPAMKHNTSLDQAFGLADQVLRQGVQGITEIVAEPGLINVDFADVKAVMSDGGAAFMAIGEGSGKRAAVDAARAALDNPLFDAPLEGASGLVLNVKGGRDLTLSQVDEIAGMVREASGSDADVVLGVVQDRKMSRRVSVTVVATGLRQAGDGRDSAPAISEPEAVVAGVALPHTAPPSTNGLSAAGAGAPTMF